jgi:hypothetical protein
VNVRPALGDRSLPRQAPEDERLSPGHTRTLARGRTFAQHWAIVRPRRDLFHVTYLGHQYHFTHHFHLPHSTCPTPSTFPQTPNSLTHHKAPHSISISLFLLTLFLFFFVFLVLFFLYYLCVFFSETKGYFNSSLGVCYEPC